MEFNSYFKLGYSAAIGVNFSIGKRVSLFGELNGISNSFEAKKSTITGWTKSSATDGNATDTNLLTGLDTHDKETEYLKEYVVDSSTSDQNSPRKDVSFSLPASSIGMTVGLVYRF